MMTSDSAKSSRIVLRKMASDEKKLHIIVFPWLAFGHMLPFLELSKSLAKRGHKISFISTPRNIQRLPTPPTPICNLIEFIPLTLPKVNGLPDIAEATSDVSSETVQYLKLSFDQLDQQFRKFVQETSPKPDWIIHDFIQHWVPEIALIAKIPTVYFSIFLAGFLTFMGPPYELEGERATRTTPEQFTVPPSWIPFKSNLRYRLHEAKRIFSDSFKPNISGRSDAQRYKTVLEHCKVVAIRSCMEVEPDWLKLLPQVVEKPVIPVGLLPPPIIQGKEIDDEGHEIIKWLDKQRSKSVVYVAFGSEATLSDELLHELALGIELANLPFIWAFRNDVKLLPFGFEERTKSYGIVAKGWVPQLKILAHESVGGFLTHSGWSSVIESLQFGHPLALLPIFSDQGINARVVMETGIAIEIERDENDGYFTKQAVANSLRKIVIEEEGESCRKRAKELKKVFTDSDIQENYVDAFVMYLQSTEAAN